MASAASIPYIKAACAGLAVAVGAGLYTSRETIVEMFTGPGKYSRIALVLILLANYKNLPFMWHFRVFYAMFKQFGRKHKFTAKDNGLNKSRPALFQPAIYRSRSPLYECDYNLHKSNSTYYSDLDVARSHFFTALISGGTKQLERNPGIVIAPDGKPAKGPWSVSLGCVVCTWKKEIKPYEQYEMWTRVLAWDRKWVYLVTHFVKAGTVRPEEYTLGRDTSMLKRFMGDGAKKAGRKVKALAKAATEPSANPLEPRIPHKALYASALTRYVIKVGRLTCHPEMVFDRSGLLPPRPGGWNTMSNGQPVEGAATEPIVGDGGEVWDWKRVEAERDRGLETAKHLLAIDDLNFEFTGEDKIALGAWDDPF